MYKEMRHVARFEDRIKPHVASRSEPWEFQTLKQDKYHVFYNVDNLVM